MADQRCQPNSVESAASTISISDSMMWAHEVLAAGDEGSTSSFRLPKAELSLPSEAHTSGAQTVSQEDLQMVPYEDLGVYMRETYPVAKLSWSNTDGVNIPLAPLPFEANSPPFRTPPHQPAQPRMEAPQLPPLAPANHFTTQMPVATSSASFANPVLVFANPGVATATRHLRFTSQFSGRQSCVVPRSILYSRQYSLDSTRTRFRVRMCPPEDSTMRNILVPHAPEVNMPTIGNVAGFRRTSHSFQEVSGAPPAAPPARAPINYLPFPTIPQRVTVADYAGAPHRYPRTASKPPRRARAPGWKRTPAADYSTYTRRLSTRGLTFTSAMGMDPLGTPAQRLAANNAVAADIDPESDLAKQIAYDLVQRINAQDKYLKNALESMAGPSCSSRL